MPRWVLREPPVLHMHMYVPTLPGTVYTCSVNLGETLESALCGGHPGTCIVAPIL